MPLPAALRAYKTPALVALAVGGYLAYQFFWPAAPPPEQPKAREQRVVQASVDPARTLHGQVDELKSQVSQLLESLGAMGKHMQGLKQDLAATKESRQQMDEQRARDKIEATQREERLTREASQREERLRQELERLRQGQAAATTAASHAAKPVASAAVMAPPVPAAFELRTIGSTKDRPKQAPSPLVHHVDTAYLAAGCFAPVRLVTGVSATSQLGGSGGATWGHPILFVIREPFDCAHKLDEIGTPAIRQRTRVPLDGCFGFASGKADLASSRVQGQGTLLSCVMPDGEAYEVPMKGYLAGQDKSQGILGTVETHESAKVGKAFIAGMIEEASAAFGLARNRVLISASGGGGQGYGGIESTMRRVADYWLEQARALQPTIFIPSETPAYLVILQGVPLEGMHLANWLKTGAM